MPPRGDISAAYHIQWHKLMLMILCGVVSPFVALRAPHLPASGFPIPFFVPHDNTGFTPLCLIISPFQGSSHHVCGDVCNVFEWQRLVGTHLGASESPYFPHPAEAFHLCWRTHPLGFAACHRLYAGGKKVRPYIAFVGIRAVYAYALSYPRCRDDVPHRLPADTGCLFTETM